MNSSPLSAQIATPETPWLGLRSFTEAAHDYFFGRQAELEDLYGRIVDKPLTVFFGQSGLGKSSLIQAALIPCLREKGFLPVRVRIEHEPDAPSPEEQMLGELQQALAGAGFESQSVMICQRLADPEYDAASFLWLLFHDPAFGFLPGAASLAPRPVFLIDQFEEIFTLGERPARRTISHAFREALAALVENRPPSALRARLESDDELSERINYRARTARVLLSLREDFLHVLERWRRFMPSLMENRFELRMLNGTQALEAVVRPGQLRVGMPPIILDEVGQAVVRFVAGAEPDVPLAEIDAVPPLLSLVCAELNAQRVASGETQVSRAQFEGHSDEILQSFYRRSFDPASYGAALAEVPDSEFALQALQYLIEEKLLSPDGYRESIAFDTIARELSRSVPADSARHLLAEIVERRLLTVEERGGVRRLELAHDVLAPIVRASRDERQEQETLAHAKREQERARAEAAAALLQRNRLRRLVGLSLALTAVAFIAAAGALFGLKEAREATEREKQAAGLALEATHKAELALTKAANATKVAEAGFQSAFDGLTSIYDDYATNTLENTPGISEAQAIRLKSSLRFYLLNQFTKLNTEQPDHRGTAYYLARLYIDEGRDAIADSRYSDAESVLTKAITWAKKHPTDSLEAAELVADAVLEHARLASNAGDLGEGKKKAEAGLAELGPLVKQWPESVRIPYVLIRLENVSFIGDSGKDNRDQMKRLVARLDDLIKKTEDYFDLVFWRFVLATNGFRGEKSFNRSATDYTEVKEVIAKFREQVAQSKKPTLVQLDKSVATLEEFLNFLAREHYSERNEENTRDTRRELLRELEVTLSLFELRLDNNRNVVSARATLLTMQEWALKDGASTLSAAELKIATDNHRLLQERLKATTSLTDVLSPAFKEYVAENATSDTKLAALEKIRKALPLIGYLDLSRMEVFLSDSGITTTVGKIREAKAPDPILDIYNQIISAYIVLYTSSSRDVRAGLINSYASNTKEIVAEWFATGQDEKLASFYHAAYQGLPIALSVGGDKSDLLYQLSIFIKFFLRKGNSDEARSLLDNSLALGDAISKDRPWDWYGLAAYGSLCFEVAEAMMKTGQSDEAQPLLRRGWMHLARMHSAEQIVERVKTLPMKGEMPTGLPREDLPFFAMFAKEPPADTKIEKMKRFTIPCDFNGLKYPFHIYTVPGPNGLQEFLNQVRWLKEIRGGTVPLEVVESFTRLWNIAQENKVSWVELCVYALGTASDEETEKEAANVEKPASSATPETPEVRFESAVETVETRESAYSRDTSETNKRKLVEACVAASDAGLHFKRWIDSERFARRTIELDAGIPAAYANLGMALLFQDKQAEALEVFRAHWNDALNGGALSNAVYDDFAALEKEGITHPGIARTKAALPEPPKKDLERTIALIKGELETGAPFWTYVAVKPSKYAEMIERQNAGKLDLHKFDEFGEIIVSGDGESPSDDVTKKVAEMYQTSPEKLNEPPK